MLGLRSRVIGLSSDVIQYLWWLDTRTIVRLGPCLGLSEKLKRKWLQSEKDWKRASIIPHPLVLEVVFLEPALEAGRHLVTPSLRTHIERLFTTSLCPDEESHLVSLECFS